MSPVMELFGESHVHLFSMISVYHGFLVRNVENSLLVSGINHLNSVEVRVASLFGKSSPVVVALSPEVHHSVMVVAFGDGVASSFDGSFQSACCGSVFASSCCGGSMFFVHVSLEASKFVAMSFHFGRADGSLAGDFCKTLLLSNSGTASLLSCDCSRAYGGKMSLMSPSTGGGYFSENFDSASVARNLSTMSAFAGSRPTVSTSGRSASIPEKDSDSTVTSNMNAALITSTAV